MLEDSETKGANGVLPHRRVRYIWQNPDRETKHHYDHRHHRVFLQLMHKHNISYPIREAAEPTSLVTQLVQTHRPPLPEWDDYDGAREQSFECRIIDRSTGEFTLPDGLMWQLIVRFHQHSMGTHTHWRDGMLLDYDYQGRALVTLVGNRIRVTVRSVAPALLLEQITGSITSYVSGWKGLTAGVWIPCTNACPNGTPGKEWFSRQTILNTKAEGLTKVSCGFPLCGKPHPVDALLNDNPSIVEVDAADLLREIEALNGRITELGDRFHRSSEERLAAERRILQLLRRNEDDAKDGPRLFTAELLDRSALRPGVLTRRVRITLWCEHSRKPLPVLDLDETSGVIDIDVPSDLLRRLAPWLRAFSTMLKPLLPVAFAGLEALSAGEAAEHQAARNLAEKSLTALTHGAEQLAALAGEAGPAARTGPVRAEHGEWRSLQVLLADADPTFGGLVKVAAEEKFRWVHRSFAGHYRAGTL